MSTFNYHLTHSAALPSIRRILRMVAIALLSLLAVLVIALTLIPVALLPIVTSVPAPVWILIVIADIAAIVLSFRTWRPARAFAATFAGSVIVAALAVIASQAFASTPPIVDASGQRLPNSIAVLEKVKLGGSQQWITIRGKDKSAPVLLFLAGGPGGGELDWTRQFLGGLEDHFVVVNWEQPGSGKSYDAVPIASLTVERYLSDAYELIQMLRTRFHQDKVYVYGESWGSILGVKLVQRYPELFHALMTSGQMVYTTQNDVMGYEFAIQFKAKQGDSKTVESLRRNGPPPYTGDGMFLNRYMPYLTVLNDYMRQNAAGDGEGTQIPAMGMEYGLFDKVNWFRGLLDIFPVVYPQLTDLDFTTQANKLEVPVYFLEGRWDVNAMTSLVERYYGVLQAPHKELIWFEQSGHTPMYEESGKFVDVVVNTVLAQTEAGQ